MGSDAPARTTFFLVLREGTEAEQIVVWDTVDVTVGRHDSNDIVVADGEVSRHHAKFQRQGDACVIDDLETGLGTFVNGERKGNHDLQHGDVVTIGSLSIRFGRTSRIIKRASNVAHASELKEFGLVASADAGGRTMLEFDTEDDIPVVDAKRAAPAVRAVTLEGEVDLADPDSSFMELGLPESDLVNPPPVRELDLELGDLSANAASGPPTAPTVANTVAAEPLPPSSAAPTAASSTVKLVLEVDGPADQVEQFVRAIRDKRISVPPLSLLVRDI